MRGRLRGRSAITACLVLLFAQPSLAAAAPGADGIYGQEMMTVPERDAYRQQLWQQKTERERETFRERHRHMMQERARDLGIPLREDGLNRLENNESPAVKRSGDGLRRLSDDPDRSGVRRWEPAPPPAGALRQWPERDIEQDWRDGHRQDRGRELPGAAGASPGWKPN